MKLSYRQKEWIGHTMPLVVMILLIVLMATCVRRQKAAMLDDCRKHGQTIARHSDGSFTCY